MNAPLIAFDTETDGLSRFCNIVGFSLATSDTDAFYVPIRIYKNNELITPWSPNALDSVKAFLTDVLTASKRLILHNAVFDAKVIENWLGISIIPYVHCDTQLLAHTVYNEEGPLGLKPLATALVDPNAENARDDVKESVKANGGSVTKTNFEMYKCDYQVLGKYAALDTIYTYGVYNALYPEIAKQQLEHLWTNEVMALLPVSYELNTTGVQVDVHYFEQLKLDIEQNIKRIEVDIYEEIKDRVSAHELERLQDDVNLTARSAFGKQIIAEGLPLDWNNEEVKQRARAWWLAKYNKPTVFNLDSSDDKAFLLYDVLGLPCEKRTKSGKPAVDKATIDILCEQYSDTSVTLKKLLERAKEKKLLSTYVESILEHNINGTIYTGFNQTGTVGGRYSSSFPINLQTLPRDDKRIKSGFIPGKGRKFVAADYSQLEPRCFASVSGETSLQKVFTSGEDFYSRIAIDVMGLQGVSATESAPNYLKKVKPEARTSGKVVALLIPYGGGPGRVAMLLHVDYEQGKQIVDAYLNSYPNLKRWMYKSELQAINKGYVTTITGRKRRANLVHRLYKNYGIKSFTKKQLKDLVAQYKVVEGYDDPIKLYLDCKNNLNNAKNVQIQGLAASICNAAMVEFYNEAKRLNLDAKIIMQVHDEIILNASDEHANEAAKLLQRCMEHNRVTKLIAVPMNAEPVITEKSLAEAK